MIHVLALISMLSAPLPALPFTSTLASTLTSPFASTLASPLPSPPAQVSSDDEGDTATPNAGAPSLTVDAGHQTLTLSGWIGESESVSGYVRLLAEGGDVGKVHVLPGDLTAVDPKTPPLARHEVRVAGDVALTAGVPRDVRVECGLPSAPGTYTGRVEFLADGQPRGAAVAVTLTVEARARPEVSVLGGDAPLRLRLVRPAGALDAWLARRLLPASAFVERWPLALDNGTRADATLLDVTPIVTGTRTGRRLDAAALGLPATPLSLPARTITTVEITPDRDALAPDAYEGTLHLTLADADERVLVPVDVAVRGGPLWPCVVLLVGILLGRLVKFMQERGGPQADVLSDVNRLRARLDALHADDRAALAAKIETLRDRVYREDLDAAKARVKALDAQIDDLVELRRLERLLAGKEQHPDGKAALALVREIRATIAVDGDAAEKIKALRAKIAALRSTLMSGGRTEAPPDVAEAASAADAVHGATVPAAPDAVAAAPTAGRRVTDFLATLTGLSDQVRAEATLLVVRPLLYVVLVLGLVAVGLKTLYVDGAPSFGADPFADALGLLLWGLSADVAGRTLSNLPSVKPAAG